MPTEEFVSKINREIKSQKRQAELATEEKLHDAKVRATQGLATWSALNAEVMACITKIPGIGRALIGDRAFSLTYDTEALRITLDEPTGKINYVGSMGKSGEFHPLVKGEELVYCANIGIPISVIEMAEKLISLLIERR